MPLFLYCLFEQCPLGVLYIFSFKILFIFLLLSNTLLICLLHSLLFIFFYFAVFPFKKNDYIIVRRYQVLQILLPYFYVELTFKWLFILGILQIESFFNKKALFNEANVTVNKVFVGL